MERVDFNIISEGWALCQNGQCPRAGECLRYQTCLQAPASVKKWECVLPHAAVDKDCEFFQSAEKVQMARGFNTVYSRLCDRKVRSAVRESLTSFFGSTGSYYRYKNGERSMSPQMQRQVADIIRRCAPDVEVTFDEFIDAYDFTSIQ